MVNVCVSSLSDQMYVYISLAYSRRGDGVPRGREAPLRAGTGHGFLRKVVEKFGESLRGRWHDRRKYVNAQKNYIKNIIYIVIYI